MTPDRFETGRLYLFGGLRRQHTFAGADAGIARQWQDFLAGDDVPGRVGQAYFGVLCGSSPDGIEYMCAVEVASLTDLPDGLGRMRVPPQPYAVFLHPHEAPLRGTWEAVLAWLARGPWQSAHRPDFERYPTADALRPAAAGIEVWVSVQPREAL